LEFEVLKIVLIAFFERIGAKKINLAWDQFRINRHR
jgi:hypothetical protein